LTARHHCGAIQIIWISAIIVRMHPHIGRDLALLGEPARPAATPLATTEAFGLTPEDIALLHGSRGAGNFISSLLSVPCPSRYQIRR